MSDMTTIDIPGEVTAAERAAARRVVLARCPDAELMLDKLGLTDAEEGA